MQTLKQEYRQFLNSNFPGFRLRKPLFYRWSPGLRFDLQDESAAGDEYFTKVTERASLVFEFVFHPSDTLFLVCMQYRDKRQKIRLSNYLFRQIDKLRKEEVHFTKETSRYEPGDTYNIAFVRLTADRIDHKNLLAAIGNTDFPSRQPRLDNNDLSTGKEIYFLHTDRNLIFHMYDDRGLDILATDKETLRPVYEKYNAWILDYDRQQIDRQFEGES